MFGFEDVNLNFKQNVSNYLQFSFEGAILKSLA